MRTQWIRRAAGCLFAAQFVGLDVAARGTRDLGAGRLLAMIASVAVLAVLATGAHVRIFRALLALLTGALFVLQAFAIRYYHAPFDLQSARSARRAWGDVGPALLHVAPAFAVGVLVAAAIEWGLLGGRARPDARRVGLALVFAACAAACAPPLRDGTPESRALSMGAALFEPRPVVPKGTVALPLLRSRRQELPSVLMIVTESIRARDYCRGPADPCDDAPEVHALLPNRVPLREMRAIASYTTISLGAIVTSQPQLGKLAELAYMPNVFDFARHVSTERTTAQAGYWSAHYAAGVFERPDMAEGMARHVSEETLPSLPPGVPDPGLDRRIVDVFTRDVGEIQGPLVGMLHLYGTHVPYVFDDAKAPHRPFRRSVTWEHLDELHAAYRNAIREQDAEIARAIRAFLAAQGDRPWLVLLTSDHGEAFGEHHAIHHGQNLYDEQIHVPGFIAASPGLLSPTQTAALRSAEHAPTSHVDVLPTVLDALDVWDSAALTPFRARMVGRSLLAPRVDAHRAVPMTSCNESFPCPQNTWGMLGDKHALVAQSWDGGFHCVPLDDSGVPVRWNPECDELKAKSFAFFATLPNGKRNE